jgi:hypothetical protein
MINSTLKEKLKENIMKNYGNNPEIEKKIIEFVDKISDSSDAEKNQILDELHQIIKDANNS